MQKVFVSIPMNGRRNEEVEKEIIEIVDYIHDMFGENIEVIDSFFTRQPTKDYKNLRLYYLGNSLIKMAECDTVVFARNWGDARGCRVEEKVAIEYGLDRMYLDGPGYSFFVPASSS